MAAFNDIGFLADDLAGWTAAAHQKYEAAFGLSHRMANMSMRMLWDMPLKDLSEAQLWASAAYGRAISSFQSAILLAQRGDLADARTLARVCAECVIVASGLLKVEGTLDKLKEDEAKHKLALCNQVIELNAGNKNADLTKFHEQKKEVESKYNDPRALKYASLAAQCGLTNLFELAYRLPSGNAAHATIPAFQRHIKQDPDGHLRFEYGPDDSDMRSTLLAANFAMISLIGIAVDFMDLKKYDAETRDLVLHWKVVEGELQRPDGA